MARLAVRFFLSVGLFLAVWWSLSRIDFLGRFKVKELTTQSEEKIGTLLYNFLGKQQQEIQLKQISRVIDSLFSRIAPPIDTKKGHISVHVFRSDEVNAFALPGNRIIVYVGMVRFCKSPEELAGVMAHETAHITRGHVAERMAKEIGISLASTLIGGQRNNEILGSVLKLFASTAFDRKQEREADSAAVAMLLAAHIDAEPFSNLLFRFSTQSGSLPKEFEWIATHPDTRDRVSDILKWQAGIHQKARPLLEAKEWSAIQKLLEYKK